MDIDVLKGLAILLVVMGHCIQYGSGRSMLWDNLFFEVPLFRIIYSFHMPLFMLLSGYLLFRSTQKHRSVNIVQRRVCSLLVPILSWSFLETILEVVKPVMYNHSLGYVVNNLLASFFYQSIGPSLWFLWAVLIFTFIVLLVREFFADSVTVYLIIGLLTFFLPDSYNICLYSFTYPFFVIGYLYARQFQVSHLNKVKIAEVFVASFVSYIFLMVFYGQDKFIYTSHFSILNGSVGRHLLIDIYRFAVGLLGSLTVIILVGYLRRVVPTVLTSCFTYLGQKTMGIYVVSTFVFSHIFPRLTVHLHGLDYLWLMAETVGVTFLSCMTIRTLRMSRITSTALLGERSYYNVL